MSTKVQHTWIWSLENQTAFQTTIVLDIVALFRQGGNYWSIHWHQATEEWVCTSIQTYLLHQCMPNSLPPNSATFTSVGSRAQLNINLAKSADLLHSWGSIGFNSDTDAGRWCHNGCPWIDGVKTDHQNVSETWIRMKRGKDKLKVVFSLSSILAEELEKFLLTVAENEAC